MGKIGLCILLILAPVGGAFEGVEGGVSVAQPTEICPDTARIPDHPVTVAASDWAATPESKVTAPTYGGSTVPAGTTAAPADEDPIRIIVVAVAVSLFIAVLLLCCCCPAQPHLGAVHVDRSVQAEAPAVVSSLNSDQVEAPEVIPSLSSDQAEAPAVVSSLNSDQVEAPEVIPSLSSDQAEAVEDTVSIHGFPSTNRRHHVVIFRRGGPRRSNDLAVSSPSADVLDLS
ncbi:uncharacterized protein LOC132579679 isoform X2 [Heteronotia binoei]|uniref:uncharacterized protein LOC132579679 isoform X2 n=1 Tax=Heteronotia binoei TaxID=13085 RepID=UPI0029313057|nr:uncharacterized protein LOC132579679 isoform X2 [Heteronotia binoei]